MKKKLLAVLLVFSLAMVTFATTAFASAPGLVTVQVDGVVVEFEGQQPIMEEGRVLVPVRGVFEHMGFEVGYDKGLAELTNEDFRILIAHGEDTFTVNGEVITPDVPQRVVDGQMLLPLRAVAEAVGAEPVWDAENRIANILTPEAEDVDELTDDEYYLDDEDDEYPADEDGEDDEYPAEDGDGYPADGEDEQDDDDEQDEDDEYPADDGNDEDETDFPEYFYAPLVGTWDFDTTGFHFTTWTYVFNDDNTGVLITDMYFDEVVELTFIWVVYTNLVGIEFDEAVPGIWYDEGWASVIVMPFNIDGDTLTFGEGDYAYVYTRR